MTSGNKMPGISDKTVIGRTLVEDRLPSHVRTLRTLTQYFQMVG